MIVLALTGGIGSGKSAVAARLSGKAGVRVVHADHLARQLMVDDPPVRAALVERFGPGTYDAAGALDRSGLAARVFGDPVEVAALNAIVHPAVLRALAREIERARTEGVRLFVVEAALVYEIGVDRLADVVVLVDAPLEMRIERVMERDGVTREQVLARAEHQLPAGQLRARADYVIDNGADLRGLNDEADALYAGLIRGADQAQIQSPGPGSDGGPAGANV